MRSLKGPIQSLEVTYLLHATEDAGKVSDAIRGLLSVGALPETEELEGHFGNKIVRVRYHLTGVEARTAIASLAARMPPNLKDKTRTGLDGMVDEHSALFMRFDKQRLVSGTLEEGSGDPVRIRVKPRVFLLKGSANEFYARLLLGGA